LFAASPWERGRPGRTPAGQKRCSAETAEAAAGGSQSGRDGRAPREDSGRDGCAPGAAIAGFIQDWVEEEAALAELGFTPDGLPDPAVWGEEALTDPEGLIAQIAAERMPPTARGASGPPYPTNPPRARSGARRRPRRPPPAVARAAGTAALPGKRTAALAGRRSPASFRTGWRRRRRWPSWVHARRAARPGGVGRGGDHRPRGAAGADRR